MKKLAVLLLLLATANVHAGETEGVGFFNGVVTLCTGTCDSFASLDIGSQLSGTFSMQFSLGTWDSSNISDFDIEIFNPGAPPKVWTGSNTTVANPLPINPQTGIIRSISTANGTVTGGTIDSLGDVKGTILMEMTIPPFDTSETWLIFEFDQGIVASLEMCTFYDTAGCIPNATQTFVAGANMQYLEDVIELTPVAVNFGSVAVGAMAQELVTMSNAGFIVHDIGNESSLPSSAFSIVADSWSRELLFPDESCDLVVRFMPPSVGPFQKEFCWNPFLGLNGFCLPVTGIGVSPVDSDGDGVFDFQDNCQQVFNDQTDADGDGFGNPCDADFNNDCTVNFLDLSAFANAFGGANPVFDLNVDSAINFLDLSLFANLFSFPPGPSEVSQICN